MSRIDDILHKIAADWNSSGALNIMRSHLAKWEGTDPKSFRNGRYYPYYDKIGKKWTIYQGLTDPKLIKKYWKTGMTPAEARSAHDPRMLEDLNYLYDRYPHYRKMTPYQQAMVASLRYNKGAGAFYRGPVRKHLQAGTLNQIPAAMAESNYVQHYDPSYTKDTPGVLVDRRGRYYTKKVIKGLDNRRKDEIATYNHPWQPEPEFPPPVRKPMPEPQLTSPPRKPAPEPQFP